MLNLSDVSKTAIITMAIRATQSENSKSDFKIRCQYNV